jgi:hypothetical protein
MGRMEYLQRAGEAARFLARLARVFDIRRGPEGQLEIVVKASVDVTIEGEVNVVAPADINVDTHGAKLHLNGRMARQIRNLPESVRFRRESAEKAEVHLQHGLRLAEPAVAVEKGASNG